MVVSIEPPKTELGKFSGSQMYRDQLSRQTETRKDFINQAPPAVFGKGSETVYDEPVRSAKQLQAQDFTTNIPPEALEGVLWQLKFGLSFQTDIVPEPYSLNIYETGGKFAKQRIPFEERT